MRLAQDRADRAPQIDWAAESGNDYGGLHLNQIDPTNGAAVEGLAVRWCGERSGPMGRIGISTAWRPHGSLNEVLSVARRHSVALEVHALASEGESVLVKSLAAAGEVEVGSLHMVAFPYLTRRENCAGDWIASENPNKAEEAMRLIEDSIEFAHAVRAKAIVVHCGFVEDPKIVEASNQCFNGRLGAGDAEELVLARASLSPRLMDRLLPRLHRIGRLSGDLSLGLENRNSVHQIPTLLELDLLLSELGEPFGYWHDCAHARAQERQAIRPRRAWLDSFGGRLVGAHIQDSTRAGKEHLALGSGDEPCFDRRMLEGRAVVLEASSANSQAAVDSSLRALVCEADRK